MVNHVGIHTPDQQLSLWYDFAILLDAASTYRSCTCATLNLIPRFKVLRRLAHNWQALPALKAGPYNEH